MIIYKPKLIFIHFPKTAGISVKQVFKDRYKFWEFNGHLPTSKVKEMYPRIWDDYTTFTVVRNPYDRVYSLYTWLISNEDIVDVDFKKSLPPTFKEWVFNLKYWLSILSLDDQNYNAKSTQTEFCDGVDVILRFENLQEDFNNFCNQINIPPIQLDTLNSSVRKADYNSVYDNEMKDIVYEYYKEDFIEYNYSK